MVSPVNTRNEEKIDKKLHKKKKKKKQSKKKMETVIQHESIGEVNVRMNY